MSIKQINDLSDSSAIDSNLETAAQNEYAKFSEYLKVWDYEGILSFDLRHMTMVRINDIPFELIAAEIVSKCPYEIKCKYPAKFLRLAFELYSGGLAVEYSGLMDEIKTMIPSLSLSESEKQHLLGEWTIISALPDSRNIQVVVEKYERAAELMNGKSSVIDAADSIITGHGILGYYLLTPGTTEEIEPLISRIADLYSGFTGEPLIGMDVLYKASVAYYRGNFAEAQKLAYKASYMLEKTKQDILQISAGELLALIAMCMGDSNCFEEAIDYLTNVTKNSKNPIPCQGITELIKCGLLSKIGGCLQTEDWIKSFDIVKGKYGTGPYNDKNVAGNEHYAPAYFSLSCWYHTIYLFESRQYSRAFAVADLMQKALGEVNNVFILECYFVLMTASCYVKFGEREKAIPLVERAIELALPDGFYMLLVYFSASLDGLVENCLKNRDTGDLKNLRHISKVFISGINLIKLELIEVELPDILTNREKDVAGLASKGMRNCDIANALGISSNTVKAHLKSIFEKLEVDKRSELWSKLNE